MPSGITRFQRIQWAREVTPGTPLAATSRWRGKGAMLDDQRTIEEIDEQIGVFNGANRTATTRLLGQIQLSSVPLTPEQFQHLMVMAFGGVANGTADGVGTDKIYTTNIPTTAKPTLAPYTVEAGDDYEVERMEYTVCTKISVSGAMEQTARVGATLMGKQVARLSGGFAAGATIPAVSELPVQNGKVFIDNEGAAYGTTQAATVIIGFKIDYTINIVPVFTMDGGLGLSYWSYTGHTITGEISFLHDTYSDANTGAMADFRARTAKLVRIDLIGDAVATGGTTYQNKRIIFDLPAKYQNPGPLGDNKGNSMVVMKLNSRYSTTAGNSGKIIVVSELAALP